MPLPLGRKFVFSPICGNIAALSDALNTMSSQVTPAIRQRILQSVNAVTELRPLGLILAVDEESHILRKPQKAPQENPYIVV